MWKKESIRYETVTISKYDANKKLIYGKEYFDAGLVVVCSDGNPYTFDRIDSAKCFSRKHNNICE